MKSYGTVGAARAREIPGVVEPPWHGSETETVENDEEDSSPLLPRSSDASRDENKAPPTPLEAWTSWWSVMFFSWCEYLSSLCAERPLKVEDIWVLDVTSTSLYCTRLFKSHVDRAACVLQAFYETQMGVLFTSGLLTLASVMCELTTPIAVYIVVDAAASGQMETIWSKGTLWTAILLIARFLRSFLLGWADFILNYALIRSVNPLNIMLLENVLSGKRYKRRKQDAEETTNLFATDTKALSATIKVFHRFWSLPLELVGQFYIFRYVAGEVMGSIVIVSCLIYLSIHLLTLRETSLLKQWLRISDRRFSELHDIFTQILGVKLNAWQPKVLKSVEAIRKEEKGVLLRHLVVRTIRITLTWAAPSMNLVATGILLTLIPNQTLNSPALTFASVAIFHAINDAFTELLEVFHIYLEFKVSLERVEAVVPVACAAQRPSTQATCSMQTVWPVVEAKVETEENEQDAVVFVHASFNDLYADSTSLLNYASIRIRRGEFVVLHGKVGSGKSVFLSAVAGLLPKTRGMAQVHGSVAYCSQSPWIQSTSVRDNVLFGRPFDATRYWNVLSACELLHDIKSLPNGDLTLVGSRSYVSLSSGQQSRIALARACYADAEIYVLDSPLDSVDSIVQCDILLKCFGKLLEHKTILLATHNPEVIRSELVDRALEMDCMELQPGSQDKRARNGSQFISKRRKLLADTAVIGGERRRKASISVDPVVGKSAGSGLTLDPTTPLDPVVLQIQSTAKARAAASASNVTSDGASRQRSISQYRRGGWKAVLKEYLSHTRNPWKLCFVLALHFLTQVLATSAIYTFGRWMSVYGELHFSNSTENAFRASLSVFHAYVVLVGVSCVSFFMAAHTTFSFSLSVSDRLFRALTMALLHARMSFFAETTVGKLLNRYCRDLRAVDSSFQDVIFVLLKTFFGCYCALFASLGWMSGHVLKANARDGAQYSEMEAIGLQPVTSTAFWIFIMLVNLALTSAIMGAFWYVSIQSNRPCSELYVMHREALSPIFSFVEEAIAGRAVIAAFGADQRDRMTTMFAAKLDHVARITWAIWCFETWLAIRSLLIENLISGILLLGLICFGHDAEPYRPATIGLLLFLLLNMRDDLKNTFIYWNALEKDLVCLQRVFEFIHLEPELSSNPDIPPVVVGPTWPRLGSISFTGVDFQYDKYETPGTQRPNVSSVQHYILRDVSFQVRGGEKIGIVGRSGAGKSSLAMALLRVNNPSRGVIQVDGVDITRVDLHILRAKVSYLPPTPVFCSGSLREYLDPSGSADDVVLWTTLQKTGLKASILKTSSRLESTLDDVVNAWSNGERQLLCLARALLLRARIVFLDEATTATDQETDFSVQRAVRQSLDSDTTLLCISHRIDAVLQFDKLLVMSDGHVAEFGTVPELVASGEGEFFDLLESAQLVY